MTLDALFVFLVLVFRDVFIVMAALMLAVTFGQQLVWLMVDIFSPREIQ